MNEHMESVHASLEKKENFYGYLWIYFGVYEVILFVLNKNWGFYEQTLPCLTGLVQTCDLLETMNKFLLYFLTTSDE